MKRALFVVVLACIVGLPAAYAKSRPAQVWVSGTAPLVIRGSGFKAHESVKILVMLAKGSLRRTAAATEGGRVVARFRTAASGCGVRAIVARGSRGTRSTWKVPERSCNVVANYPE